ncbi:hypothetical protein [Streptacidiphilus sp. PAMC 29251]
MADKTDHTHSAQFRVPRIMWEAYGRVAERLTSDRSALLLDHVRADIKHFGDERDLADLDQAERELAERRARKGGRPRTSGADSSQADAKLQG